MNAVRPSLSLLALLLAVPARGVAPDKAGCKDHPLFPTRMPNYQLTRCETKEFGAVEFFAAKGPKTVVEGKVTELTYAVESKADDQSGLAVTRNYQNALEKIGGKVLATVPTWWVNGSVVVDGKEAWVQAERGNGKIWLKIVEKQPMAQHVVADAASFKNDLAAAGHVAVYGIYFDTGKAVLKPESAPALQEVAKLLAGDPALGLWVVGHTDAVGQLEANLKLSQDRAEAVVQALTSAHGVAAARLRSHGVGPLAPVASNDTEEGRAKNRRVELVKRQ